MTDKAPVKKPSQSPAPPAAATLEQAATEALKDLKVKLPDVATAIENYLVPLREKNIAALGDGQVFKLRTKGDGVIKAFIEKVVLSTANGGLANIGPVTIRTYAGYKALEDAIGLVTVNPTTVVTDGVAQPNPYVRRKATGEIQDVAARAICFGFTSKGVPVVSDRTAIFDVGTYRLVDLIAKAKKDAANFKFMPKGQAPAETKGASWAVYSLDASVDLCVNLANPEIATFFGEIMNRSRKAVEFCQTFAQRNAIKAHPAVPLTTKPVSMGQQGGPPVVQETIRVVSWRQVGGPTLQWGGMNYEDLVDSVESLTARDAKVRVISSTDRVSESDPDIEQAVADDAAAERIGESSAEATADKLQELISKPDGDAAETASDEASEAEQRKMLCVTLGKMKDQRPAKLAKILAKHGLKQGDIDEDFGDVLKLRAVVEEMSTAGDK